jgi:hypothetical protein
MSDTASKDASKQKTVAGWIFGGMSFIPLFGVLFGIIAMVLGTVKRRKGPIFLGIGGILFTVFIYGNLYYWGVVATTGPYAELKVPLTKQLMETDAGQIALFKNQHGALPATLDEVASSTLETVMFSMTDAWINKFKYVPQKDGHFQLVSAGPDKVFTTSDDIQETF